jgi:hypothetical protein
LPKIHLEKLDLPVSSQSGTWNLLSDIFPIFFSIYVKSC